MRLFRRSDPVALVHPISAFWEWWGRQGRTIDPHQPSAALEQLSQRVAAVHPGLTWHFGAGSESEHRLTVSAGGVAEVRPTAERWLRAAPPADATWEFRASQEAEPEAFNEILEIAGSKLDLCKTLFRVEPVEEMLRVNVGVHHPAFPDVPRQVRLQVTYLVLDWLLGEDDVERWLGQIEALETAPDTVGDGAGLLRAVASIAERRDPDEWSLAQWQEADGTPGIALFRQALRWIDYPTLDVHHSIHASYASQPNGLPANGAALEPLRRLDYELEALLGSRGILVGHQTIAGGRTFHVYTDGEDQNIAAGLADWARSRRLAIESASDPAWRRVRHFTG
ncbi:DUF695 domain-containing protein [Sinomonas gamaensis]|uniref:DUF695 domain-containing protein n=1 Tax=Sinomonas gamaensis TaxID=2565624 RepID=UPI001108D242|nr:DUF695 domain-containing protein [Sinomonas gamaensis]